MALTPAAHDPVLVADRHRRDPGRPLREPAPTVPDRLPGRDVVHPRHQRAQGQRRAQAVPDEPVHRQARPDRVQRHVRVVQHRARVGRVPDPGVHVEPVERGEEPVELLPRELGVALR